MLMKVVEKDKVISGMLRDELKRCQEMVDSLEQSMAPLPKGSISRRSKRYKGKEYSYYYLKYREGDKVINKHIPKGEIDDLRDKLKLRKKYEREMRSYRAKIAYLHRMLGIGEKKTRGKTRQ
jgi:hypothetical protein